MKICSVAYRYSCVNHYKLEAHTMKVTTKMARHARQARKRYFAAQTFFIHN